MYNNKLTLNRDKKTTPPVRSTDYDELLKGIYVENKEPADDKIKNLLDAIEYHIKDCIIRVCGLSDFSYDTYSVKELLDFTLNNFTDKFKLIENSDIFNIKKIKEQLSSFGIKISDESNEYIDDFVKSVLLIQLRETVFSDDMFTKMKMCGKLGVDGKVLEFNDFNEIKKYWFFCKLMSNAIVSKKIDNSIVHNAHDKEYLLLASMYDSLDSICGIFIKSIVDNEDEKVYLNQLINHIGIITDNNYISAIKLMRDASVKAALGWKKKINENNNMDNKDKQRDIKEIDKQLEWIREERIETIGYVYENLHKVCDIVVSGLCKLESYDKNSEHKELIAQIKLNCFIDYLNRSSEQYANANYGGEDFLKLCKVEDGVDIINLIFNYISNNLIDIEEVKLFLDAVREVERRIENNNTLSDEIKEKRKLKLRFDFINGYAINKIIANRSSRKYNPQVLDVFNIIFVALGTVSIIPGGIYFLIRSEANDNFNNIFYNYLINHLREMGVIKSSGDLWTMKNFIKDFTGRIVAEWNINNLQIYGNNGELMYENTQKNKGSVFNIEYNKIFIKALKNSIGNFMGNTQHKNKNEILDEIERRFIGTSYRLDRQYNKIYNVYDKHSICQLSNDDIMKFRVGGKNNNRNRENECFNYNYFTPEEIFWNVIFLENKIRRKNKTKQYKKRLLESYNNVERNDIFNILENDENSKIFNDYEDINNANINNAMILLTSNRNNKNQLMSNSNISNVNKQSDNVVFFDPLKYNGEFKLLKNTFYYDNKSKIIYFCDGVENLIQVGEFKRIKKTNSGELTLYTDVDVTGKKCGIFNKLVNTCIGNSFRKGESQRIGKLSELNNCLRQWCRDYKQKDQDIFREYEANIMRNDLSNIYDSYSGLLEDFEKNEFSFVWALPDKKHSSSKIETVNAAYNLVHNDPMSVFLSRNLPRMFDSLDCGGGSEQNEKYKKAYMDFINVIGNDFKKIKDNGDKDEIKNTFRKFVNSYKAFITLAKDEKYHNIINYTKSYFQNKMYVYYKVRKGEIISFDEKEYCNSREYEFYSGDIYEKALDNDDANYDSRICKDIYDVDTLKLFENNISTLLKKYDYLLENDEKELINVKLSNVLTGVSEKEPDILDYEKFDKKEYEKKIKRIKNSEDKISDGLTEEQRREKEKVDKELKQLKTFIENKSDYIAENIRSNDKYKSASIIVRKIINLREKKECDNIIPNKDDLLYVFNIVKNQTSNPFIVAIRQIYSEKLKQVENESHNITIIRKKKKMVGVSNKK